MDSKTKRAIISGLVYHSATDALGSLESCLDKGLFDQEDLLEWARSHSFSFPDRIMTGWDEVRIDVKIYAWILDNLLDLLTTKDFLMIMKHRCWLYISNRCDEELRTNLEIKDLSCEYAMKKLSGQSLEEYLQSKKITDILSMFYTNTIRETADIQGLFVHLIDRLDNISDHKDIPSLCALTQQA